MNPPLLVIVSRAVRKASCEMGVFGITGMVTIKLDEPNWSRFLVEARAAMSSNQPFIGPKPTAITDDEVTLLGARIVKADPEEIAAKIEPDYARILPSKAGL